MYEAFYGFNQKPFSMLPDPSFLFLSKKHQAALTLLEYGLMNQVGFCILSGEPGTGKTTILRALLNRLDKDDMTVGLISNTHQSFGGLLDWILSVFDLHKANLTHVEMHQLFVDFLINEYANNRHVLLIVDEAQNMDPESLEELRMLSNVNTETDQLLQVVLAGQPLLKENLRKPELMQFAQRIGVDYHLQPLSLTETFGYIQHRLVVAGAERDVFTPEACERIHCYSGGSPRLINLLSETALVYGFADEQEVVDADLVEEMVHERMKDSVVPIVNRDKVKQALSKNNEQLVKDFPWIRPGGGTQGLKPAAKTTAETTIEAKQAGAGAGRKKKPSEADMLASSISVAPDTPEAPSDKKDGAVGGVTERKNASVNTSANVRDDKIDSSEVVITADRADPLESKATKGDDAISREEVFRNKIEEVAPKKKSILKYTVFAGLIALGLMIGAYFLNDYAPYKNLFNKQSEQAKELLDKGEKSLDQSKPDTQGAKDQSEIDGTKVAEPVYENTKQKDIRSRSGVSSS